MSVATGLKVFTTRSVIALEHASTRMRQLKTGVGLFCVAICAGLAFLFVPGLASAQLPTCIPGLTCPPPDITPPSVDITSPAAGATVSGTTNVTASASDDRSVARVRFFVDGDFLAEDDTAPYAAAWDTTAVVDGSHTLTATARDAAGNEASSSPVAVTVSNAAAPPPQETRRFEESDPSVNLSVGWLQSNPDDWSAWSGGSAVYSRIPSSRAAFSFTGTSVTWIGYRSVDSGIARVFVDGAFVADIDLFARRNESSVRVYTVKDLHNSAHTLTIEVTGLGHPDSQGNLVVVDGFDVPAPVVSHMQETDPNVSFTSGWGQADPAKPWSAGAAAISMTPGAQATLAFNGTAIGWIGARDAEGGIAHVYIDGALAGEVDTYFHTLKLQDTLFEAKGLADGNHTLTIEVTGRANAASSGTRVLVDAFDVTTPGTRFQEEDPAIVYSGHWIYGNLNRSWSEGAISQSNAPGAQATFTFTGSSVTWIGCRKQTTGIARVYVDGVFVREIDTYEAPPIEGYQTPVFTASGLASGTHTLTIEATGRSNPAASSNYIVIDAIDVRP
ncbi:MAG: Ig-like domain-containing protein [Woeseiaceae bacterium]